MMETIALVSLAVSLITNIVLAYKYYYEALSRRNESYASIINAYKDTVESLHSENVRLRKRVENLECELKVLRKYVEDLHDYLGNLQPWMFKEGVKLPPFPKMPEQVRKGL